MSEEEARFMKENKCLPFSSMKETDFENAATYYTNDYKSEEQPKIYRRLVKAYYNGYIVKKETRYYIKFPIWDASELDRTYLNVLEASGGWELHNKIQHSGVKTQFTQNEIDIMEKDERARGLDLNALKVKVPDDEIKD